MPIHVHHARRQVAIRLFTFFSSQDCLLFYVYLHILFLNGFSAVLTTHLFRRVKFHIAMVASLLSSLHCFAEGSGWNDWINEIAEVRVCNCLSVDISKRIFLENENIQSSAISFQFIVRWNWQKFPLFREHVGTIATLGKFFQFFHSLYYLISLQLG